MRLRRSSSALSSYDSIMDTMTNVVAVLIIVVAVTQLSVVDAVRGSQEKLPEVAPEALAQARADEDALRAQLATLRERWEALLAKAPGRRIELTDLRRANAVLAAEVEGPTDFHARSATLTAEIVRLEKQEGDLRAEKAEALDRLGELRAALDTSAAKLVERTVVRLPNPDSARAEGKEIFRFICRRGQVFPLDQPKLVATLLQEIQNVTGGLGNRTRTQVWRAVAAELDNVKARFTSNDFGDSYFRLKVLGEDKATSYSVGVEFELRDSAVGTSVETLAASESALHVQLAQLDPHKQWIQFQVRDDSFDVYLRARMVAEQAGFAVGWDVMGAENFGGWFTGSGGGDPSIPD